MHTIHDPVKTMILRGCVVPICTHMALRVGSAVIGIQYSYCPAKSHEATLPFAYCNVLARWRPDELTAVRLLT
jgi:hypothetical protein